MNAAAVVKELRKDGTENATKVSSSYHAPALKPTCSKVFQQANNGEAPGSVNAYLALRERQKQNIEVPTTPEDVPELNMEEPATEIVKPGNVYVTCSFLMCIFNFLGIHINLCYIFCVA